MKNLIFKTFGLLIVFSMAMASCKEEVELAEVRIIPEELTLYQYADPQKLEVELYPANASNKDIQWRTSLNTVFTITQDGVISPVGTGTAYAIAYQGDRELGRCAVSVFRVALDRDEMVLFLGVTQELNAIFFPAKVNVGISWSSDNNSVATVNNEGLVTAVGKGTATITAADHDGEFEAQCVVTVNSNLLVNSGFEEPVELVAPFTTELYGWTQIDMDWVTAFYKLGEEKSGPTGLGPGAATAISLTARANKLNGDSGDGLVAANGNAVYFTALGGLRGNCAAKLANAGGNLTSGFYQIVTVEPGKTYDFGAIVGMRPNADNQSLKRHETLKLLSPDGMEVYYETLLDPMDPQEGDVLEEYANPTAFRWASIRYITDSYTVPTDGSITEIRFQIDGRSLGTGTNEGLPVTMIDNCFFEPSN